MPESPTSPMKPFVNQPCPPDAVQRTRAAFKAMHQSGCFVLPNPWDAGSASLLASLGFKALATTSSGHAWSCGRPDGTLGLDETLANMRQIVETTALPVNADFESGFAATPEGVAESVRLAVATGVAGLSIEDSTGDPDAPLRSVDESVERMRAARAAIDACGGETLLVGRAENFFVGHPDLDDAIRRLQAYADAGADCLYAPGIRTREQIRTVVSALAPRPVNVLIGWPSDLTVQELADLGVRRVSVGGALARAAWAGFMRAAQGIVQDGRFDGFQDALAGSQLNGLFGGRSVD